MGKFEIYKDKRGEYRFRLKASNGKNILASEGYTTKTSCKKGVESVKRNSKNDNRFKRKETKTGFKFDLTAPNGEVIGISEVYTSKAACENGIESVKKNAPDAQVIELD